uniref:Uncharacterized protein n=1 Tax=Aegilops tauschii TaxID=37682 RepID=M8B9C3_AEGTA
MDPWVSSQPSLSLDLHVGLPPMGHPHHHQAAPMVALAKPKVLVEENFMQLKKDPEVAVLESELQRVSEENRRLGEMLREVASKYEALQGQFTDMPGGQGRVPMAQVRAEGDQGQPLPQSLLPVLLRPRLPRQEEGAEERRGQDHTRGDVRGRAQPLPAPAVAGKPPQAPTTPHHPQQHKQEAAAAAVSGESAAAASELIRRNLAEQMAMTLTRDPSFKAALVSALSGRILELSPTRDIN